MIYRGSWRKTSVAVKIFKIDSAHDNSIKDFISECHAMEALRHPNIVMFLGACTKGPQYAIVLEYCEGGTLWSLLQKGSLDIKWEDRRLLALDTARAMNYLHERPKPVLHRDLKSLNLLLDQNNRIKLADFGWTKGLENYMTGKIGTYQWMAPEVIASQQYTEKADVFSFGIILWEIASREAPYRSTGYAYGF